MLYNLKGYFKEKVHLFLLLLSKWQLCIYVSQITIAETPLSLKEIVKHITFYKMLFYFKNLNVLENPFISNGE